MIRNAGGSVADWKDIYRLLVTSLRASSVHFQQLSFDSVTVGLWGLSKAHAAAEPNALPGQVVLPAERSVVTDWVYWADLLLRTFDGATTAAALASSLDSQDLSVLHFEPTSAPLLPAHAVLADHGRKQLLLLVRGTSSWADCLTDIVAHTQPLGAGHVHSGMLDCARSVLDHCMPILQQQLQDTPGYRIHCLGHSLGGGVAALAAWLLRTTPELKQQLQGASGVMATGFGTPPVMTQDLSDAAASFTRTLVHDWDLVPRTCVASLALLRSELETQRDAVYGSNSLLSSLKSSGVLEGGASLLGSVATAAIASKFIPGAGSAAKGRWLAAGIAD